MRENLDLSKDRASGLPEWVCQQRERRLLYQGPMKCAGEPCFVTDPRGFQISTLPSANRALFPHCLCGTKDSHQGLFLADISAVVLLLRGHRAATTQDREEGRGVESPAACAPRSLPAWHRELQGTAVRRRPQPGGSMSAGSPSWDRPVRSEVLPAVKALPGQGLAATNTSLFLFYFFNFYF